MGNLHSSWLHRQRESATQTPSERNNSRSRSSTSIARGQQLSEPVISNSHNFNSNNTTEETVQSSLPYELRRTVARLRRRGTTFRGKHYYLFPIGEDAYVIISRRFTYRQFKFER